VRTHPWGFACEYRLLKNSASSFLPLPWQVRFSLMRFVVAGPDRNLGRDGDSGSVS
jgi:hypothetical protein